MSHVGQPERGAAKLLVIKAALETSSYHGHFVSSIFSAPFQQNKNKNLFILVGKLVYDLGTWCCSVKQQFFFHVLVDILN